MFMPAVSFYGFHQVHTWNFTLFADRISGFLQTDHAMPLFYKIGIFILLLSAFKANAENSEAGRITLNLKDLEQKSSLLLNEDIWLMDPDPMDSAAHATEFQNGTNPRAFITQAHIRPGTTTASFRLTIQLDGNARLSLMVPEFPYYELYLGDERLVRHETSSGEAQRLYREVLLGSGTEFHLRIIVQRQSDFWAPYTRFKLGLTEHISHEQKMAEFFGAFFLGLVLITALYHFALALMIPQNKQSLHFGIFLICLALRASLSDSEQILIRMQPDFSWEWSWKLGFIGYYLSLPSFLAYLSSIFPRTVPKFYLYLVWASALLMLGITLTSRVDVYAKLTDFYHLVTFFTLFVGISSFIRAWRRALPGVKPLIATIVMLTTAVINDVFMVTYIVQTKSLLDYAIVIFICSQTAIISYYYARSFRDVVHTHQQLQKLVYRHVVTQIADGKILEETMPVGFHKAVVLSFDVIRSSHIKHPQFNRALEHLMAACQEILHEGYDPGKARARGYRIKEMGDGLLASIGFPFATPNLENNADTAVKTAVRFCEVFREEMEKLRYSEPIFCSVGITQGLVEGFFPKSGIRQYDVRGRPLILATRYESMRNIVFKVTGETSSLIFIQDEVYQALSPDLRAEFQRWDCLQKGHRIRDDAHALQAWYRRLPGAAAASSSQGNTVASSETIGPGPRAVS
jgi:class 3 adenylate cyclase